MEGSNRREGSAFPGMTIALAADCFQNQLCTNRVSTDYLNQSSGSGIRIPNIRCENPSQKRPPQPRPRRRHRILSHDSEREIVRLGPKLDSHHQIPWAIRTRIDQRRVVHNSSKVRLQESIKWTWAVKGPADPSPGRDQTMTVFLDPREPSRNPSDDLQSLPVRNRIDPPGSRFGDLTIS
jgi:hypothetical protein